MPMSVDQVKVLLLSAPPLIQALSSRQTISTKAQRDSASDQRSQLITIREKFQVFTGKSQKDPRLRKLLRDYDKRILPGLVKAVETSGKAIQKFDQAVNREDLFRTKTPKNVAADASDAQVCFEKQLLVLEEETRVDPEEVEALRYVHEQTASLKELAQDVSQLVDEQQKDVDKIEDNSESASLLMVDGVTELAIAKKREAKKHTTRGSLVSAVTGGVAGLVVAGPVGLAIGALGGAGIGATVGGGITQVSKRSIDAELRSLKSIRAIKVHPVTGSVTCRFEVFEQQSWGMVKQRGWCVHSPKWADIYGKLLRPGAPTPDAPALDPAKALHFAVDDEIKQEDVDSLNWQWRGSWHVDLSRKNTDSHGWDYAYKFSHSGKWFPEMTRTTFVRRRLWLHHITGSPKKEPVRKLPSEGLDGFSQKSATVESKVSLKSREAMGHIEGALQNMDEAGNIIALHAEQVETQGEQIRKSLKNSLLLSDTGEHADRIRRAADVSGVFMNMLSNPSKKSVKFTRERDAKQRQPIPTNQLVNSDDPLDVLSQKCSTQYEVVKAVNTELDEQLEHLKRLEDTTDKNRQKVKTLHKKLF